MQRSSTYHICDTYSVELRALVYYFEFLQADRVRVSLLARDTKYRNIINQDEVNFNVVVSIFTIMCGMHIILILLFVIALVGTSYENHSLFGCPANCLQIQVIKF